MHPQAYTSFLIDTMIRLIAKPPTCHKRWDGIRSFGLVRFLSSILPICKTRRIMTGGLTRREFLKETISKTTILSVGFGLERWINIQEAVQCKNCGSINLYTMSHFSSRIFSQEPLYCHDCGINLRTQDYDIPCRHCHYYSKDTLDRTSSYSVPACAQIPFPNYKYLKKSGKPSFSAHDLRFWYRGHRF